MDIYEKIQIEENLKKQMDKETFNILNELTKNIKVEFYTKKIKKDYKTC